MQNKAETIIRPSIVATGEEALETEGTGRAEVQVGAWPTKVRSANYVGLWARTRSLDGA